MRKVIFRCQNGRAFKIMVCMHDGIDHLKLESFKEILAMGLC